MGISELLRQTIVGLAVHVPLLVAGRDEARAVLDVDAVDDVARMIGP